MSVSIIIPHYNRSILLEETLNSVKSQLLQSWEILVVDDGSTPSEWDIIQKFEASNIHVLQRQQGLKGPSACRNLAVKHAKGKYLLFLDSDDLLAPFCLSERVKEMELNPDCNLGIFLMEQFSSVIGDKGKIFNILVSPMEAVGLFLQNSNPWNVTCPLWKKEFFEKVGGFDEAMLFMEDPELHLRAISHPEANISCYYNKPADCYYRINHLDETKKAFWHNSIYYRILFYKKLSDKKSPLLITHVNDIKKGIYNLVRTFLYHRINEYPELFGLLLQWMKMSGIFSSFEMVRVKYLTIMGNSSSSILQALHTRGLCYRMLPRS